MQRHLELNQKSHYGKEKSEATVVMDLLKGLE